MSQKLKIYILHTPLPFIGHTQNSFCFIGYTMKICRHQSQA
ncbi:hypothetical protein HanXRQr2_Chr09g0383131 [Helianthus annuus]|uniref:Uncharacterized protein n=1 Tax=Helianthus annuus TaxID=4232 RepID=A0A9K3I4S9_HELAN|nr:hypothetical protein HanXRQr2_Chr09g0383131 [Helianthus annuus]